ncbi:multidrug efflux SMR transporter [Campylobacter sp. US33a]|uniref:Spermidine export protein MdtJ n=1 Tax=Campylobacter sp. CCS1377 TaxID=3158229 RepID=A0AAU7E9X1_9BACT|nr:multidrug efflux SMR transporter [Campylobacter sp. US33a]MCW1360079.1 multidrug efflux SMR transporter [Campylobacter jejuni]TEY02380.1 multidrug efflux SMR transporter [Campylobacter sp. US33a]
MLLKTKMIAWIFLLGAIVAEVIGTSFLKNENQFIAYGAMAFFIALSYYLMGLAIKKIQVGIAYAVWELLGVVLILLISFVFFNESLTTTQIIGIVLSIIGILMINIGEVKE